MAVFIAHSSEIEKNFDANGFAKMELLPGTYSGGITNYKCFLKAGKTYSPELYAGKTVLLIFGKGKGYLCDAESSYNICELSFYVPDFDKQTYTIHAVEDMEFIFSIVEMNEWDMEGFNACHNYLPAFKRMSQCDRYLQDCKGPHTMSWHVFTSKQIGRIMVGIVRAVGEGTVEKGHPSVEQWNYCIGNADFTLTVGDESVNTKSGDWSYVPAGLDHSLTAEPGKEVFYVWYEHFTQEDYCRES